MKLVEEWRSAAYGARSKYIAIRLTEKCTVFQKWAVDVLRLEGYAVEVANDMPVIHLDEQYRLVGRVIMIHNDFRYIGAFLERRCFGMWLSRSSNIETLVDLGQELAKLESYNKLWLYLTG